jgi:hypothetical protein
MRRRQSRGLAQQEEAMISTPAAGRTPRPACRWKIALVFALLAQSALADTVCVGKVAGQDVVTNGLLAFAYLRIGHELSLQKRGPNLYAECPSDNSRNWECEEPTGWWELSEQGERLVGTWRKTRTGSARPIVLQATTRSYNDVLLSANRTVIGKPMRTGTVGWALKKELRSGVALPVLLTGPDPAGLARINAALAKQFEAAVVDALTMEDYEPDEKVLYADERMVAIGGTTGFDGGGAHPSEFFSAATWDLRTGDAIDWEALMRPAADGAVDLSRSGSFLAAVLRELQRAAKDDDGGCLSGATETMQCNERVCADVPRVEGRTGWQMYPTPQGLAVAPDVYSEAARGCRGETVVVPWRDVRGGLKEPSALLPR